MKIIEQNTSYAKLKTIFSSIQNNRKCLAWALSTVYYASTSTGTRWTIKMRNRKRTHNHLAVLQCVCYKFQRICVVICAETLLNIWMVSNVLANYTYYMVCVCVYWHTLNWLDLLKNTQIRNTPPYICVCMYIFRLFFHR